MSKSESETVQKLSHRGIDLIKLLGMSNPDLMEPLRVRQRRKPS